MTYTIKARPTVYKGIQMRSRLEAHAASRLDHVGIPWEYEPDCFASEAGQCLPDFKLFGKPFYLEVKPLGVLSTEQIKALRRKAYDIIETTIKGDFAWVVWEVESTPDPSKALVEWTKYDRLNYGTGGVMPAVSYLQGIWGGLFLGAAWE